MTFTLEMTAVILFLVINLLVGLYHGTGVKTVERYAVGDRTFNTASIAATIAATYISGDLFIAYVSETYNSSFDKNGLKSAIFV